MNAHTLVTGTMIVALVLSLWGGWRAKEWGGPLIVAGITLSVLTTPLNLDYVGLLVMAVGFVVSVLERKASERRASP